MSEPLDPRALFETFERHGVDYVLIGALAGVLHGSSLMTTNADITPERSAENLRRLLGALVELGHDESARTLRDSPPCTIESTAGTVNIRLEVAGVSGFEELASRAVEFEVFGVRVKVAALHDLMHSKEAANRDKDRAALPYLYALEDEIAAAERAGESSG